MSQVMVKQKSTCVKRIAIVALGYLALHDDWAPLASLVAAYMSYVVQLGHPQSGPQATVAACGRTILCSQNQSALSPKTKRPELVDTICTKGFKNRLYGNDGNFTTVRRLNVVNGCTSVTAADTVFSTPQQPFL